MNPVRNPINFSQGKTKNMTISNKISNRMKNSNPIIKSGHNIVLVITALLFIAVLIYGTFFVDGVKQASAGSAHNVSGYAWSSNIGWISFNCTDTSSCGAVDYGVNIAVNGDMSGYAWSDNIGWISFNESDLLGCPSGSCNAKLSENSLQGWARALSNGDDWDGWISLNGSSYGITKNGNNLEGYAWDATDIGNKQIGIGWIEFDPSFGGVMITPDTLTVTLSANPTAVPSGGNSTLTWSSSNATACEGGLGWSGSKAFSGSEVVGPHTIDTVYRLICANVISQASDDATVFVLPQCSDGINNTDPEDTLSDTNDPGCYDSGAYDANDNNETDTLLECSNFFDDDGDGVSDAGDPDCYGSGGYNPSDNSESGSSGGSQCADGIDNDGDGVSDARDPDCYGSGGYNPSDDSESGTSGGSQCTDGIDNDGDGLLDFPNDPGCSDANDNRELDIKFEEF